MQLPQACIAAPRSRPVSRPVTQLCARTLVCSRDPVRAAFADRSRCSTRPPARIPTTPQPPRLSSAYLIWASSPASAPAGSRAMRPPQARVAASALPASALCRLSLLLSSACTHAATPHRANPSHWRPRSGLSPMGGATRYRWVPTPVTSCLHWSPPDLPPQPSPASACGGACLTRLVPYPSSGASRLARLPTARLFFVWLGRWRALAFTPRLPLTRAPSSSAITHATKGWADGERWLPRLVCR